MSASELAIHFSPYDLKRLELYSRSMVDYHLIMDLIPTVARLFFLNQLGDVSLSVAQCVSHVRFSEISPICVLFVLFICLFFRTFLKLVAEKFN